MNNILLCNAAYIFYTSENEANYEELAAVVAAQYTEAKLLIEPVAP